MRSLWVIALLIGLASAIVLVLFAPIVLDPNFANGGMAMVCNQRGCISFVQYDSISYAYGGWGAYYQTGVNYYTVTGWVCFGCMPEPPGHYTPCCVAPYAGIIWPVVYSLLAGVIVTTAFLAVTFSRRPARC